MALTFTRIASPDGIVRLRVSGGDWSDAVVRKTARTWASREVHTLVGGPSNVQRTRGATLVDFPVVTRTATDRDVHDVAPTPEAAPTATPDLADLVAQIAALQAQVAALAANPPAQENSFHRDVISRKGAEKAAAACKTCKDYGVVRAGGKRKGDAYLSESGARGAANPMPCPACKGSRKTA